MPTEEEEPEAAVWIRPTAEGLDRGPGPCSGGSSLEVRDAGQIDCRGGLEEEGDVKVNSTIAAWVTRRRWLLTLGARQGGAGDQHALGGTVLEVMTNT